jgi:hypothetical protein
MSKKIYINYEQWNGTGGRIPYIENPDIKKKVFPIFYSDVNIYSNSHQIVNNKNPTQKFNLNNQFVFEPKETVDKKEFDLEDLNHLLNEEIVINENKKIPFHILLVHNRFSIIKKFYQNVTSKYLRLLHPKLFTEGEIFHVKKIFNKYFVLHRVSNDLISVSAFPNILNKFCFGNKLKELLNILFSPDLNATDEVLKQEILKCFPDQQAYINLSDFIASSGEIIKIPKEGTERTRESIDKEFNDKLQKMNNDIIAIKDYKLIDTYIQNDIVEIKKLLEFNCILNKMQSNDLFTDFKIGLDELFYCCYIGCRLFKPKLTVGHISNNIFPINQYNLISNLINKNFDEIQQIISDSKKDISDYKDKIAKIEKKLIKSKEKYAIYLTEMKVENDNRFALGQSDLKILMYKKPDYTLPDIEIKNKKYFLYEYFKTLPRYDNYSATIYIHKGNEMSYPNCVENTLLQMIKTHCWNSEEKKFDSALLPVTSNGKLIKFINELTPDNNDSTYIKTLFGNLVSNVEKLRHVYGNDSTYEIESNTSNYIDVLNYLFGTEVTFDNFNRIFETINKSPNINKIYIQLNSDVDTEVPQEVDNSNNDFFTRDTKEIIKPPSATPLESVIIYECNEAKVNFLINQGHSSHNTTKNTQTAIVEETARNKKIFEEYYYNKLICFFSQNYSFLRDNDVKISKLFSSKDKHYINCVELLFDFNLISAEHLNREKYTFTYLKLISEKNCSDYLKIINKLNFIHFLIIECILQSNYIQNIVGKDTKAFDNYMALILEHLVIDKEYIINKNIITGTSIIYEMIEQIKYMHTPLGSMKPVITEKNRVKFQDKFIKPILEIYQKDIVLLKRMFLEVAVPDNKSPRTLLELVQTGSLIKVFPIFQEYIKLLTN